MELKLFPYSFVEYDTGTYPHLELLPLEQLVTYHRLKFMRNYYFRKLPPSFMHLWQTNAERNPVRELRNANDYFVPPHRIELAKRLPLYFLQPGMPKMMKNSTPLCLYT